MRRFVEPLIFTVPAWFLIFALTGVWLDSDTLMVVALVPIVVLVVAIAVWMAAERWLAALRRRP